MIYQIIIDENNLVLGYNKNCRTADGINIDDIPEEVTTNFDVGKYKYIDGEFVFNPDYVQIEKKEQNASPPTNADLQAEIARLNEKNDLLESCVMQLADTVYAV